MVKEKNKFKVLIVYPNLPLMLVPSIAVALFNRILKSNGYKVELFDTTDYVNEASSSPQNRAKFLQTRQFSDEDDLGSKCAQVSAAWTLASELKIDQPDLTFIGLQQKEWEGPNLGCTESSGGSQEITPGFEVEFSYSGSNYLVRSNQYGSLVKIC